MAGISRAYKRRNNMVANTGGPVMCLDAGSRLSYPGSGTTWTDLSGNGNTGTLTNGPTYSSANGGSIVFDGVNDSVVVPNGYTNTIKADDTHTISLWFNTTVTGMPVLIDFYQTSDALGGFSELNNAVGFYWGYSGNYRIYTGMSITNSVWHHVDFVKTGAGDSGNLYLNGILQSTYTGSLGSAPNENSGILIGNYRSGGFALNGNISSVSIYNRALSAAEISTNFELTRGRYLPKVTPSVEYLVVAGGGGGSVGTNAGGGGGAGGYLANTVAVGVGVVNTITIGAGGSGVTGRGIGTSGASSSALGFTAVGGGRGGGYGGNGGLSGGSGGGASYPSAGGAGTSGQGFAGGAGGYFLALPLPADSGGGGGGASIVGENGRGNAGIAGAGGAGSASSISGSSVSYAGGGGGSTNDNATRSLGGAGGGGSGATFGSGSGIAGTASTGGGGGAGNGGNSLNTSGAGGSGIVVIRYPDSYDAASTTTGSPTVTVAGGYRVYIWTGSGTITF